MSLVAVEPGSGVLVFESESTTLLDIPGAAFDAMIDEVNRPADNDRAGNFGMQRALLAFEALFRHSAGVDTIELISETGSRAMVDRSTINRVRASIEENAAEAGAQTIELSGRLLELDLAKRSFRVHGILGDVETISFSDVMEPLVRETLDSFVSATIAVTTSGERELLNLQSLADAPLTRFNERRSIETIIDEQQIVPLDDIESLALPEASEIPLDQFQSVIKSLRRSADQ
jgi:hypothetical protein